MIKSILKAFGLMTVKDHEYVERQLRNEKELNKVLLENSAEDWIIVGSDNTHVSNLTFDTTKKMVILPGVKNISLSGCITYGDFNHKAFFGFNEK